VERFPDDNRNLIYHLISFLRIAAKEVHSRLTLMDDENLAVVFSPGFLRSSSMDPMMAMTMANKEKDFVKSMIRTLQLPFDSKCVIPDRMRRSTLSFADCPHIKDGDTERSVIPPGSKSPANTRRLSKQIRPDDQGLEKEFRFSYLSFFIVALTASFQSSKDYWEKTTQKMATEAKKPVRRMSARSLSTIVKKPIDNK
jgi:hypothetical protein